MHWPVVLALPPVVLLAACSAPSKGVEAAAPGGDAGSAQRAAAASRDRPAADASIAGVLTPPVDGARTFDAAWSIVRDTHFDPRHLDPAVGGVDWIAVRDELRPAASAAESPEQLRTQLETMLARLGQSHFTIVAGESIPLSSGPGAPSGRPWTSSEEPLSPAPPAAGTLGIDVRVIDGAAVVSGLVGGLPGASTGVQLGWEILAVDGHRVASALETLAAEAARRSRPSSWRCLLESQRIVEMLDGPLGESRTVLFRAPDGATIERRLSLWPMPGMLVHLGDLPPLHARLRTRLASEQELAAATAFAPRGVGAEHPDQPGADQRHADQLRVGLIAFNVWMPPMARSFHQALDRYRDADGVVVDLRGNAGGVGGMATTLASHFTRKSLSLGTLRTRSEALEFLVQPCFATAEADLAEPFEGPLAILVDELSASTSEIFAGGLQRAGRARLFGRRTAGATLPARTSRLPNGDTLVHAVADFTLPDGNRLEGLGVTPDEVVPLRRADLSAERDEVLLAALRWIAASGERSGDAPIRRVAADVRRTQGCVDPAPADSLTSAPLAAPHSRLP